MMITIKSLQIGRVITEGDPNARDLLTRQWTTGFYKRPVAGPVELTAGGLAGDGVADRRHHGGTDKAALCYPLSHYKLWAAEHPELEMSPGGFGENLTLDGIDETSACLGDRYRIGQCEVEVSQPRQPCWKIARRWGVKTLTKEVTQTGRTGWYVRVLAGGTIEAGQQLQLIERPNPQWPVARANDVMYGREADRMAVFELMNLEGLAEAWREGIA